VTESGARRAKCYGGYCGPFQLEDKSRGLGSQCDADSMQLSSESNDLNADSGASSDGVSKVVHHTGILHVERHFGLVWNASRV
jgi:hypothetical protein